MKNSVKLPAPQRELEFPLMKAFEKRRTIRKWENTPVLEQDISNLLWAACGVTKQPYGKVKSKRTAPSACNSQAIRVYITTENGVFLYNENKHELIRIMTKDIREHIGTQKMMKSAPVGFLYVADFSKRTGIIKSNEGTKMFIAGTEAGLMSQNVYLYCSATNLNTVLIALVNRDNLKKLMTLSEYEEVIYTQVIGKAPEA